MRAPRTPATTIATRMGGAGRRCVAKQDGGRSAVPVVQNLLDFRKRFDEDFKSIGYLIKAAKIEQAAPFAIRDTAPRTSETIATSEKTGGHVRPQARHGGFLNEWHPQRQAGPFRHQSRRSYAVRSRHVDHRDARLARRRRREDRKPQGRRAGPQRIFGAQGCRQLLFHAAERQQALRHAQSQGPARQGDAAQPHQKGRRLRREFRAGRDREAGLLLRGGVQAQPAHRLCDGQGLRQRQPIRVRTWRST